MNHVPNILLLSAPIAAIKLFFTVPQEVEIAEEGGNKRKNAFSIVKSPFHRPHHLEIEVANFLPERKSSEAKTSIFFKTAS